MSYSRALAAVAACSAAILVCASARAASINLATGLDASGNLQAGGDEGDAWWQVAGAVDPAAPPYAYVVGTHSADSGWPFWPVNGPGSSWIAANPDVPNGNGLLTFTRDFYVNDPSTAAIAGGMWAMDDDGLLTLNGNLLSTEPGGRPWGYGLISFSTTPGDFVPGLNVLTMQITGTDFWVEGARLEGTLTGDVSDTTPVTPPPIHGGRSVPEPATWSVMLIGFAGLGAALRRGRPQRSLSRI
jgi:hypothetical protein